MTQTVELYLRVNDREQFKASVLLLMSELTVCQWRLACLIGYSELQECDVAKVLCEGAPDEMADIIIGTWREGAPTITKEQWHNRHCELDPDPW